MPPQRLVPSRYAVVVDDFPMPGWVLVYQVLRKKSSALPAETWRTLARGADDPALDTSRANLVDAGLLVPEGADELSTCLAWMAAPDAEDPTLFVNVVVTRACNCDCSYCILRDTLSASHMSVATARSVAAWIGRRLETPEPRRVLNLRFFGGEPLLALPAIEAVLEHLAPLCAARGIAFQPAISTNGVLLTDEVVDRLARFGAMQYCIPVAGDRTCHDARRPTRNGGSSFEAALAGIKAGSRTERVAVNCNFDAGNAATFGPVLERLEADGLRDRVRILFSPIYHSVLNDQTHPVPRYASEVDLGLAEGLMNDAMARGFRVDSDFGFFPCPMDRRHYFVIQPDGALQRCVLLSSFTAPIGHAAEPTAGASSPPAPVPRLQGRPLAPHCAACPWLPACGGGCEHHRNSLAATGGPDLCERPYFERFGRFCIRLKFLEALLGPGA